MPNKRAEILRRNLSFLSIPIFSNSIHLTMRTIWLTFFQLHECFLRFITKNYSRGKEGTGILFFELKMIGVSTIRFTWIEYLRSRTPTIDGIMKPQQQQQQQMNVRSVRVNSIHYENDENIVPTQLLFILFSLRSIAQFTSVETEVVNILPFNKRSWAQRMGSFAHLAWKINN